MIDFEDTGSDDEGDAGLPAWLATFADLMSLLMCFFVLLLSFSEMDVQKYKQVAGSMKDAFGVQNEINVKDIPKGTSVIAQEFSPGRPDPTVVNEVRQKTTDSNRNTLDTRVAEPGEAEKGKGEDDAQKGEEEEPPKDEKDLEAEEAKRLLVEQLKELIEQTERDAKRIAEALDEEIKAGKVEVNNAGRNITIRVLENSFPPGSATIDPGYIPILDKARTTLKDVNGKIAVEGHTDNLPIATKEFRSNWDLSSERALAVAHELLKNKVLPNSRFMVSGYAETRPIAKNDNDQNRSKNRRVEIVIRQGLNSNVSKDLKKLQQNHNSLLQTLQVEEGLSQEDIRALEDLL